MKMVEFRTDKRFIRRARELKTIAAMLHMYCQAQHTAVERGSAALCADCHQLLAYAQRRLERCPFGDAKPTCNRCLVHCYSADRREQVRIVMRWAGPRMLRHHPILGIRHLLDGRRPTPRLPQNKKAIDRS